MRTRIRKGQRGLSLIEVTIMLLVLMLLTSVLAPSIFDFVQDAQWVKVKEDCEVLAISLARLIKDVGPRLVAQPDPNPPAAYPEFKMDLMVSDGRPAESDPGSVVGFPGGGLVNWWTKTDGALPLPYMSTCEEQLITNRRADGAGGFLPGTFYQEASGPGFGLAWGQGWRGAYLSPPCGPDPWGYAYQVNTKWLTTEFYAGGVWPEFENHCNDVFCLSPGKNGHIETNFGQSPGGPYGLFRGGDDWVTVISPCDP